MILETLIFLKDINYSKLKILNHIIRFIAKFKGVSQINEFETFNISFFN